MSHCHSKSGFINHSEAEEADLVNVVELIMFLYIPRMNLNYVPIFLG